jgi:lipopolysaccharide/colanic/teichoic acid biosynthesis glycosyltransferase
MAVHAFIAFAMLLKGERPRLLLYLVTFSMVVGTIGSGQTSGLIALVAGSVGFAIVTKSIRKILLYGVPMMLVVSAMLYPVIEARVVGLSNEGVVTSYQRDGIESLPGRDQPFALYVTNPGSSWDVRQFNLRTHFLPRFESLNDWLWGVSPQARVPLPAVGGNTEFIWIESGHLWLFWIGGLPFFLAFMAWMFYGGRTMWGLSRQLDGPVGVAAIAAFSSFCALFAVQTFDPHITLRGTADIFWPVLALAMVGYAHIEWAPEQGSRIVPAQGRHGYGRLQREDPSIASRRAALRRLEPSLLMKFGKRLFDIVTSGLGLILLSVPLLVVMAAIRLTSRGPAIFRQERVGLHEKPFTIYKLRTMTVNNDDSEHREFVTEQLLNPDATANTEDGAFKLQDSRVTRVGGILRRLSFDELPQLYNVLKGDMSLIGPRRALAWEVEMFDERHRMRSLVKPGCTGLWQVSGRNKLSSLQMLDLDLDYAGRVSVFRDIGILFKTPMVLFRGDGAR